MDTTKTNWLSTLQPEQTKQTPQVQHDELEELSDNELQSVVGGLLEVKLNNNLITQVGYYDLDAL